MTRRSDSNSINVDVAARLDLMSLNSLRNQTHFSLSL